MRGPTGRTPASPSCTARIRTGRFPRTSPATPRCPGSGRHGAARRRSTGPRSRLPPSRSPALPAHRPDVRHGCSRHSRRSGCCWRHSRRRGSRGTPSSPARSSVGTRSWPCTRRAVGTTTPGWRRWSQGRSPSRPPAGASSPGRPGRRRSSSSGCRCCSCRSARSRRVTRGAASGTSASPAPSRRSPSSPRGATAPAGCTPSSRSYARQASRRATPSRPGWRSSACRTVSPPGRSRSSSSRPTCGLPARRRGDAPGSGLTSALLLLTTPWLVVWYLAWPVTLAGSEEDLTAQWLTVALSAYLLPQAIPL